MQKLANLADNCRKSEGIPVGLERDLDPHRDQRNTNLENYLQSSSADQTSINNSANENCKYLDPRLACGIVRFKLPRHLYTNTPRANPNGGEY